ncbi:hypothetical protein A3B18_02505 [Candidatus Giovannonibacteria bacterium RIFCSPLOWO2_01_FULL_46_13]|uniref:Tfp pilus assembly protein PilF n=1 Tax=Candidatus Giovannonibacteria bacterium RIFCSPLOWO2_01_FULL_46_13 TaxID=1798352 RepID=A0A1F5X5A7_9BACT|nr:MAG: hypothetical protein A3B18_02505 [Candidatus Giovannonibacteria bacterium RIFCSPLOWO2_01_FULL_46_13]
MSDGFKEQVAYISDLGSRASEWLFYGLIFLFPFFTLPLTIFPVALNKSYLLYFAILVIGVVYLISSLQAGTFKIPKGLAGVFLLVFLASIAISSLFSQSPHASFSGIGSEPGTLSAIGLFVLTLIMSFLILDSEEKVFRGLFALFGSFLVLALFQIFQALLKIPVFSSLGTDPTFNLFGSWNELGILAGLVILVAAIFIDSLPGSFLKIISWVVFIFSFVIAALVNFELVWWVLAGVSIIFLAYNYSQHRDSRSLFKISFVVLLISLVFIFAGDLMTDLINQFGINFIEIRPNMEFTLKTASGALNENPAFGYGPNTFLYAWFDYRPSEILATPFWETRFNSGFGFIPTLLVTIGMVGVIALLGFLAFFLYYGFKALVKSYSASSFLIWATFAGAFYLWVFAFIYSGGFALLFTLFLFSGMFLGLAMKKGIIDYYEISLFEHSVVGFMSALLIILFIVLGVSWFSVIAQKYYASILYGQGVEAFVAGDLDKSEDFLARAVRFDQRDLYYRSLSDLGIARMQQIINSSASMSPEEIQARFEATLGQTIEYAQSASSLNPVDAANWMSLGRVYEAVMPLGIQGVPELAHGAYARAAEEFSSSPEPLLASARVELARNDLPKAREFLMKAISLKKDFAQAHFLLAQLEAATGNKDLAIKSSETTALLAPNDVGVLFQLGLLYYQDERIDNARSVFEQATRVNTNYSNARYFLGLIYSRQGDNEKSLAEFRKIEELNPDNAEVKKIIENLTSGREPLFGISPPNDPPEKRGNVPIRE